MYSVEYRAIELTAFGTLALARCFGFTDRLVNSGILRISYTLGGMSHP